MLILQIDDATKLLSLGREDITLYGVFAVIIAGLTYGITYFLKKYNKAMEDRLTDHKEFSNKLIEANDESNEISNKVLQALEVLKNIINVNR